MPSRLSPQWVCDNSCTWGHDVKLDVAGTIEPKSTQQAGQGAICEWSYVIHDTQSAQISQKQDVHNIDAIIKQYALPVITTIALWQLVYLDT